MKSRNRKMSFRTSTPKKQILLSLPRSSTPNKFYSLIKNNHYQSKIRTELCYHHYQRSKIRLDSLLYRPNNGYCDHKNVKQTWNI